MTSEHESISPHPKPFSMALLAPRQWGVWIVIGLLRLLQWLPEGWRLALGRWLGNLAYRRNHKRRAIVELNLRWTFPDLSEEERGRMARRFFQQTAQCQLDYGLLWWGGKDELDRRLRLEGEEHLRPHVEAGRPVILLTCHHVALDYAGIAANRHYRMLSLFKQFRNPLVNWFMARGRTRFGGIIYERSDNMLPLVRRVREGYGFYYLPDEDHGPEKSVFAPFFGVPTATLTALPRLTRLCHAVVIPFMAYHADGIYTARFFPALENYPGGEKQADAARMNEALEAMIRLAPEQYLWSLRIFQTRPAGEELPYEMRGRVRAAAGQ